MDARSILTAHIKALDRELEQARAGLRQIDENLRERVQDDVGGKIEDKRRSLAYLQQDEVDRDEPLGECWRSFREVRDGCQPLLNECFALVQGALARSTSQDGKLCRIADFLLDGLSDLGLNHLFARWGRFTILAEAEYFGEMAAIIRLRYPGANIWNLPVAAHEFGHFVVERVEVRGDDPRFEDYVQRYRRLLPQPPSWIKDPRTLESYEQAQRMFLHEYYADVFATYVLGPAYAYTCLLLRFDPQTAYTDGRAHPSAQKRAHAILQTLEEMNDYAGAVDNLRSWWYGSVRHASPSGESASGETLERLQKFVKELHHRLGTKMPRVRYDSWPQANRLSGRIADPELEPEDKLRDVLNAAWLYRINASDDDRRDDDDLDNQAKALCEGIVARSPQEPKMAV